jgi:hypothetical protein
MMRFGSFLAAASVAVSLSAVPALAQEKSQGEITLAQASKRAPAVRNTGTHVYVLRGFMDIFSTGMDDLNGKLNRSGIRSSVHNHSEFGVLAEQIADRHRRGIRENVVIVGHSLGANDAFPMAERLADYGIPVPLIITFDPTANMNAGRNVQRVVNFYSSTNGWGTSIGRGPGFKGSLSNVDLSRRGEVGHTDIDKSPALHSQSIGFIRSIGGGRAAPATAEAPKQESKQESKQDGAAAGSKPAESAQAAKPADTAQATKPADTAQATKPAETAQAPVKDMGPATTASAPTPAAAATETGAPKSN